MKEEKLDARDLLDVDRLPRIEAKSNPATGGKKQRSGA